MIPNESRQIRSIPIENMMPISSLIAEKIKSDSTVGISPGAPFKSPVPKKLPQLIANSDCDI